MLVDVKWTLKDFFPMLNLYLSTDAWKQVISIGSPSLLQATNAFTLRCKLSALIIIGPRWEYDKAAEYAV